MLLASAITCLALNVYFESRNQPLLGQMAVAAVTLNRADGDKEKICQVVTQPYQFSWTINRLKKHGKYYVLPNKYVPKNIEAWIQSWQVAEKILKNGAQGIVHGATFYHATWVNPSWDDKMKKVAQIGDHVFYVQQPKSQLSSGEQQWHLTALSQTPTTTYGAVFPQSTQMESTQDSKSFLTRLSDAPKQSEPLVAKPSFMLAIFFMFVAVFLPLFSIQRKTPMPS
jgi:hypothetical protein